MNGPVREYPRLDIPRPGESLADRFARTVEAHRSRPALASENLNLTYGELDSIADHLAHALIARGGQPGDRIALLMRHDTPQIAAMLAVLKAGRIVVALNPTDAAARLRLAIEDAEPALVLADQENAVLANEIARDFCATAGYDDLARERASQPKLTIDSEATAYIVYTSGSSGRPKGVMMNHHQVMHNALRVSAALGMGAKDRLALLPSLSGLHGVNAAWWSLLHGALLRPFPTMERGVTGLAEWMVRHRITVFSISPSLFRAFAKSMKEGQRIASMRMIRIGGEIVTSEDFKVLQEHFPDDCILLNTLSSSEAGSMTYRRYSKSDKVSEGPLAVGHTFEGIDIAITDEQGRPVEPGEAGQIVVTSPYLSQGYWRNERLTAERYSRDSRGVPVVRSGDWGRINADGMLEFVGRKDTRVKIHGASVELDEVEQALRKAPSVEKAVVCAWEGPNSTQLVAYVTLRRGNTSSSSSLRREVRALLPELMVPSIFIVMDELPFTPHGKIDRQKLLETHPPKAQQQAASSFVTEIEASLGAIWSEAFDLPGIGRDDNFFELGGDSLIASVIAARLYSETGAELNLGMFAENPTVASMAAIVDRLQQAKSDDSIIRRVPRDRPLPLSFTQERIWDDSQTAQSMAINTLARRFRIQGDLDVAVLRECMSYLVRRHELLRTTFAVSDGQPVQVIHPPIESPLPVIDLTKTPDPVKAAREIASLQKPEIDLRKGPLVRFTLLKIGEREHWLLRLTHHILCDDRSWKVYLEELAQLYAARVRGEAPPLPEFEPLQYADYASWQRKFFSSETQSCQNMISWWKRVLDAPPRKLALPRRKRPAAAKVDPLEGVIYSVIDAETSRGLTEIASQARATTFQIGLAILASVLAARTGQRDFVIGTYASNRKRGELQRMFGDFTNQITLRLRCDFTQTFRSWLMTVRDTVMEALAYSELPYDELRKALRRDKRKIPDVRVIYRLHQARISAESAGLEFMMPEPEIIEMPLEFDLSQDDQDYSGRFKFDAGIYDPDAIRTMIGQWNRFSETVSRHPDLPVKELLAMSGIDARIPTAAEKLLARLFRR